MYPHTCTNAEPPKYRSLVENPREIDLEASVGRDPWDACRDVMNERDETAVQRWIDDIDSLLVIIGLFSAALTTFIIEFYRQLKVDPADTMVLLLKDLVSLEASSQFINSTNVDLHRHLFRGSSYSPVGSTIRMNTAWVVALLCSLIAAFTGILVKQWLRAYLSEIPTSPIESVPIRQLRHDGLQTWRVEEIVGCLPILMEIALVLFLYGLLELLWSLNATIAGVSTAIVAVFLIFLAVTTVMPTFFPSSPFKSPQAWFLWKLVVRLFSLWRRFIRPVPSGLSIGHSGSTWIEREVEIGRLRGDELNGRALARVYKGSIDEDFRDVICSCINTLPIDIAASFVFELMATRCQCSVEALLESIRNPGADFILETLSLKSGTRLRRGARRLQSMVLDILHKMHSKPFGITTLVDLLKILRKLIIDSEEGVCENPSHRRAWDTLTSFITPHYPFQVPRLCLEILWDMTQVRCNMDYCPVGMQNVLTYSRDAFARNDNESFVRASGILFDRLPAMPNTLVKERCEVLKRLGEWMEDLTQYFLSQNTQKKRLDSGIRIKWCSGFVAVANVDRGLISAELISLLEEGADMGLVEWDEEERSALHHLKALFHHDDLKVKKERESMEYDISESRTGTAYCIMVSCKGWSSKMYTRSVGDTL